jgi:ribosomal protein S18 acetylase RimI-like enzyme
MDMAVNIRLATLEEAPLVREIMLAAFAEHEGALPVDSSAHTETVDEVLDEMRQGGAVLAEDGTRAVGSARFKPDGEDLYVGRLAVLPDDRRRGVASAIMRFLEEIARDLGHDAIRIGVRESLPSNVELYRSLGYEVWTIEPHPRGPDRVLIMGKRVTGSTPG